MRIRLKAKARRSSIRLRTLSLSSASAAASKLLLERGLSKLKAGRAKKVIFRVYTSGTPWIDTICIHLCKCEGQWLLWKSTDVYSRSDWQWYKTTVLNFACILEHVKKQVKDLDFYKSLSLFSHGSKFKTNQYRKIRLQIFDIWCKNVREMC